jgi:hypothetical protein
MDSVDTEMPFPAVVIGEAGILNPVEPAVPDVGQSQPHVERGFELVLDDLFVCQEREVLFVGELIDLPQSADVEFGRFLFGEGHRAIDKVRDTLTPSLFPAMGESG